MKLVLHPGHAKCGSTTIQKAIIKNRNLLEGHGYIIPDPQLRTPGDKGFNPNGETPRAFFRHVMEQDDLSALNSRLATIREKYSSSNKTVLISAENLVNQLNKPSGRNVHETLAENFSDYKVVYYIKRQDDFILSAWQQWGYKRGLNIQKFIGQCLKVRNPNYLAVVDFFESFYGKGSLDVTPLDVDFLFGGDLLSDFFIKLGVNKPFDVPGNAIENKSLNPHICELFLKFDFLFDDIHDEFLKYRLSRLVKDSPGLFMRDDDYLPVKARRRIMNAFHKDNNLISERFFDGRDWIKGKVDFDDSLKKESRSARNEAVQVVAEAFARLVK